MGGVPALMSAGWALFSQMEEAFLTPCTGDDPKPPEGGALA